MPAVAQGVPSAERAFQKLKEPYNLMRDRFTNAFASLRTTVGVVSDYYGNSMLLGRGNQLTQSQVMAATATTDLPDDIRIYWRARAYDFYNNGQWRSSFTQLSPFDPMKDSFAGQPSLGRIPATFQIAAAADLTTLLAPSQPIWVSRNAVSTVAINTDSSVDLSAVRLSPSLHAGEIYSVQASLPNATEAQLRSSGNSYPTWVTQRYLQLPASITPRVRELAVQIASGKDNPYDIALAVTDWLRTNIQYSDTIPELPANREPIDWFLFDLKQGFCNYYATAEVVLLRSVGIPARWSTGYAEGEELPGKSFVVRQRDAHAWPEVYFSGIGWIEFEPTASQPAIARLPGNINDPGVNNTNSASNQYLQDIQRLQEEEMRSLREAARLDLLNQPLTPVQRVVSILPLVVALILLISGLILVWIIFLPPVPVFLVAAMARLGIHPPERLQKLAHKSLAKSTRDRKLPALPILFETTILRIGLRPPAILVRWAQRARLPALSRAYLEINSALHRLGKKPQSTDTPLERTQSLITLIPPAEEPANVLVSEYQLSLFANQLGDETGATQAGRAIRNLSVRAMVVRWLKRFQEPERRRKPIARQRL